MMSPSPDLGIPGPYTAIVIGARGGVGEAFVSWLSAHDEVNRILATSRDPRWCQHTPSNSRVIRRRLDLTDESSVSGLLDVLDDESPPVRLVINASGLLHDAEVQPERSWRDLDPKQMVRLFEVHALGVAVLMKHLLPRLPRTGRSVFATLSARVGSIGDNRLGGWYSYRASKAAQNMLVKCAAIEAARRSPDLVMLALHPGTVHSPLSEPFTSRLRAGHTVFTPEQSCAHLCSVISGCVPSDSGGFFAWDGEPIPW